MNIEFIKMHGLGNDFIIIDYKFCAGVISTQFVKNICNRTMGVGCDQLIIYERIHSTNTYKVQIYNPDGSGASACGNGMRCLGKLLYDLYGMLQFEFVIFDRSVFAKIQHNGDVSVAMGHASILSIQNTIDQLASRYSLAPEDLVCVDIGNQHLVVFADNISTEEQNLMAPILSCDTLFPLQINVGFTRFVNNAIYLDVYERGVGFTNACGSGACASFIASFARGFVESRANVYFRYGFLTLELMHNSIVEQWWHGASHATNISYTAHDLLECGNVIMSGSTTKVAHGVYYAID